MAFITKEDLTSLIYEENIDVITRDDDDKVNLAIETAMLEAATFLDRYDSEAIFATTGTDRDKYKLLIGYIKDIALWYLLKVSNASINIEIAREGYNDAIKSLKRVQGKVMKDWPLAESGFNSTLRYGSNPKFFTERF